MKKLLLAGAALAGLMATGAANAADLPLRTAPAAPVAATAIPIFTWSGFYAGLQVGYGWGDNNRSFETVTSVDLDGDRVADVVAVDNGFFGDDEGDGFLGGAHVGYNFQFGSIVLGAEADIEATGIGGGREFTFRDVDTGDLYTVETGHDITWQGSLRGRLGFALDRTLIYATGGLAFADFDGESRTFAGPLGSYFTRDGDGLEWGWTLGAGVEYAFTNNLTARVEYRYTNFDRGNTRFDDVAFRSGGDDVDFHTVRAGLSFKF